MKPPLYGSEADEVDLFIFWNTNSAFTQKFARKSNCRAREKHSELRHSSDADNWVSFVERNCFKVLNAVEIGDGYTRAACAVHKFISINMERIVNLIGSINFIQPILFSICLFHAIFSPHMPFPRLTLIRHLCVIIIIRGWNNSAIIWNIIRTECERNSAFARANDEYQAARRRLKSPDRTPFT